MSVWTGRGCYSFGPRIRGIGEEGCYTRAGHFGDLVVGGGISSSGWSTDTWSKSSSRASVFWLARKFLTLIEDGGA